MQCGTAHKRCTLKRLKQLIEEKRARNFRRRLRTIWAIAGQSREAGTELGFNSYTKETKGTKNFISILIPSQPANNFGYCSAAKASGDGSTGFKCR
jgi:hypothetical protein